MSSTTLLNARRKRTFFWLLFVCALAVATNQSAWAGIEDKKLSPSQLLDRTCTVVREYAKQPSLNDAWHAGWLNKYVDRLNTDFEAETAISEMLAQSLQDKRWFLHSIKPFQSPHKGGLGLTYKKAFDGSLVIVCAQRDMPAGLAGLKFGDVITAIDDLPTPTTLDDCAAALRGEPGSKVRVKFKRNGQNLEATMIRKELSDTQEVVCTVLGSIAYYRPAPFIGGDDSWAYTRKAVGDLASMNAAGLILDLRDSSAKTGEKRGKFAGLFLPRNTKVAVARTVDGEDKGTITDDEPLLPSLPIVILINHGSYDQAEVTADCLKHYGRAKLVGESTLGLYFETNGSMILDRDHVLVFPLIECFHIDGSSFQNSGVQPHYVVSEKEFLPGEGPWYTNNKPGSTPSPDLRNKAGQIADKQLRTAIDVLSKKR